MFGGWGGCCAYRINSFSPVLSQRTSIRNLWTAPPGQNARFVCGVEGGSLRVSSPHPAPQLALWLRPEIPEPQGVEGYCVNSEQPKFALWGIFRGIL